MYTVKAFMRYASPVRHLLLLGALCAALGSAASLIQPLALQELLSGDTLWDRRVLLAALMVAAVLVSSVFSACTGHLQVVAGQGIISQARHRIINHASTVDGSRLEQVRGSRLTSLVVSDATLLESGVTVSVIQLASASTMLIGSIAVLQHLYAPLVWAIVASSLIGVAVIAIGSPFLQGRRRVVQQRTAQLIEDVTGTFDKLRILRVYGLTHHHMSRLNQQVDDVRDAAGSVSRVQSTVGPLAHLSFQMGTCTAAIIGSFAVHHGTIQPGDIAAVMMLGGMISSPMQALVGILVAFQGAAVAMERIDNLTNEPVEQVSRQPITYWSSFRPTRPQISADEVRFSYTPERPALDGVSLHTGGSGLVAVVGESGAGKSTLLSVLSGLLPPHSGTLRLGNLTLEPHTVQAWRSKIAYVDQDASVLNGTVRSNVDLGQRLSEDELLAVLTQLGLRDKIASLPLGLDTPVGWNAPHFSGGERQRIALARAIASQRPLILLDEPTSALDATSERLAISALTSMQDRLTVCVTHRLSLAEVADTVVVLKDGVVAETGSHHELVRRGGEYAHLWDAWCGTQDSAPAAPAPAVDAAPAVLAPQESTGHRATAQRAQLAMV